MSQSSHRLSWMGAHTHRIQAGYPLGSNPDGWRQLVRQAVQERGRTPFDFNQHNHLVGLDAEKDTLGARGYIISGYIVI